MTEVHSKKTTRFKNRAGKSHSMALVVLMGFLVLAGVYAYSQGMIPSSGGSIAPGNVVSGGSSSSSSSSGNIMAGQLVTVNVSPVDQLDSSALTEATNVKHTWLERNNDGTFTLQTTGTAKTIKVSNDGKIWAAIETQASGQSYVFSPKYTAMSESTFNNDCTYIDWDGDNDRQYVCSFHTTGLTPQSQNFGVIPTRNLNTKFLNENTMTISAPSDVSSISGTAGSTADVTYTLTGTKGDVTYINRILVVLNTTTDTKLSAANSYVHFVEFGIQKSLADFRKWQDGTNTNFECLIDSNFNCVSQTDYRLNNAYPIEFSKSGAGTVLVKMHTSWDLGSTGDAESIATKILSVNEVDEGNTELSDTVIYTS